MGRKEWRLLAPRTGAKHGVCFADEKMSEARVATGGWDPPGAGRCAMIRLRDGLIVELFGHSFWVRAGG